MRRDYTIRAANEQDLETLIAFTLQEGTEAEGATLDPDAASRGVRAAFEDPPRARYWVAEHEGRVVASTSVVTEWSNFNGGDYWWIQSLFIVPPHRGTGLLELLADHLARAAAEAGALELRLYAHQENERALRADPRTGFTNAPYVLMRRTSSDGAAPPAP